VLAAGGEDLLSALMPHRRIQKVQVLQRFFSVEPTFKFYFSLQGVGISDPPCFQKDLFHGFAFLSQYFSIIILL